MGKLEQALESRGSRRDLLKILGVGGVALTTACGLPLKPPEQLKVTDLGLKIDEAGFFRAVNIGPQLSVITVSSDKNKMDCLGPWGDFCVANSSPNFTVVINKPMADFMAEQSRVLNPIRPTRMIFVDEWLNVNEKEHVGGFTATTNGDREIDIVISLKVAAFDAFKAMEKQNIPLDHFNSIFSFLVSKYTAREWGHAGAEAKSLAKPGKLVPAKEETDKTHPQVYAFSDRYDQLYRQAEARQLGLQGLIFAVQPERRDLLAYKAQLFAEARNLGLMQ